MLDYEIKIKTRITSVYFDDHVIITNLALHLFLLSHLISLIRFSIYVLY